MILKEYKTSDQGPGGINDSGEAVTHKGKTDSKSEVKKRPDKPSNPPRERKPETPQRSSTAFFGKNKIIGADPSRKSSGKNMMRLIIKSYDSHFLDSTARFMCEVLKKNDVPYSGPVPLPVSTKRFVVKSSPHVYKDARHRFEIRESARMLQFPESASAVSALSGVDSIHPSVTVSVKVKPSKDLAKNGNVQSKSHKDGDK
jgi:ribosomal protein S10